MRSRLRVWCVAFGLAASATWIVAGEGPPEAAAPEVQYQLANLLFDATRYREALDAYTKATAHAEGDLLYRARLGLVNTALRLAEFQMAREQGEALNAHAPGNPEAMAAYADALWSSAQFDEAEQWDRDALALNPESWRARQGLARALVGRSRLGDALEEALTAQRLAPRERDVYFTIGGIYERMHRYEEAAAALTTYLDMLPDKDRGEAALFTRARLRFLKAFQGRVPNEVVTGGDRLNTVPFRLVGGKIVVRGRVNGGGTIDFVLDTGSEATVISRPVAARWGVRPIAFTLSAGVGEAGVRGLQLGRLDQLEIGALKVRNVPVLIKNPPLRGLPTAERDSISPLALGLSTIVDYQKKTLTIGRELPAEPATFTLPMRMQRLAMVRGVVNQLPTYFIVDTGGEVISISTDTAQALRHEVPRRIPLKVYGTSGWDREAFLLTGVSLDFDRIQYRNFPVVVLNLRAPSVLLGFQVGGIVGHRFLSKYRVAMDLARSEIRLQQY